MTTKIFRELPVPPDAHKVDQAVEVIRGWIIDSKLQCSLLPTLWEETPDVWGILLADFLGHISHALAQRSNMTEAQLREIITQRLLGELQKPTAEHEGEFQ